LKKLGVSKGVIDHIESCATFDLETGQGRSFSDDRYWQNLMRVTTHPTITINNQTYQGDLDGKDLSIALCASFKDRPELCYD